MKILTAENPVIHVQHNTYYVETDNTHGLFNKKLRYHEQHSASVMLSWCILWHFSREIC